ncbi:MAG: 2-oxo acid dehydrogenase subunit E2, partial [Cyclobacteriaceae bacterium]|nr:2-oxo acid dehydrogenase subunit E2 [Cyclobacteriaceae bacterium]
MAEVIRMPKMSDTMEEGVIAAWMKKVGDHVNSGDILAEVETDKATMELESYQDGVLLHIGVNEKESVPVDGVIAIIGEKGENIQTLLQDLSNGNSAAPQTPAPETPAAPAAAIDTSGIKATVIRMPKMSDTMTDGVIASWQKKVGDKVSSGDILAEVETDKATMELESYEDGELLYTAVEAGNSVAVDAIIAIIGEKGADIQTLLKAETQVGTSPQTAPAPAAPASSAPAQAASAPATSQSNERIKASPLARKMAADKGIDITAVNGSGEGGRIIKKDVENFTPSATTAPVAAQASQPAFVMPSVVGQEKSTDIPLSQMRKVIAKRLSESKFTAPHFYITMEINMGKAIEARNSMNEIAPVKISFNDMVIKAVAASLRQNPDINVSWMGDKMVKHDHIHIGVAVAIPDGLVVPVIRFADNKSMS